MKAIWKSFLLGGLIFTMSFVPYKKKVVQVFLIGDSTVADYTLEADYQSKRHPLAGWGQVFGDQVIATAILDRLLHHSTIVNIKGESYRLKEKRKAGLLTRSEPYTAQESAAAPEPPT